MSFRNRIVHGYSEICISQEEYSLILNQYGYAYKMLSNPADFLPNKTEQNHKVLREVEIGRESEQVQGQLNFNSPGEREWYNNLIEILKKQGKSDKEIDIYARKALEELRKEDDVPF
jgi:hypothetical protein